MSTHTFRATRELRSEKRKRPVKAQFDVQVDVDRILDALALKALDNKGERAIEIGGAVIVRLRKVYLTEAHD